MDSSSIGEWFRSFVARLREDDDDDEEELDLRSFRGPGRVPMIVAWAGGLACLVALVYRFRFGTDSTDETFSIALPYRFVLGDKPFVDEVSIQQTSGLVLFPFVWAYVKLTHGTSGIVLFVRWVHLFIKALAALSVYAAAKRWLAFRSSAVAVAFVPFAFVPHSLPNVGYNVLGMTLVTAGTFLSAAAISDPTPDRRRLALAGLAQAIAAFAYPPMVVAPLFASVLVFALAPRDRLAAFGSFVGGCVVALLLVLPSFAWGGLAGLRHSLNWGVHSGSPKLQHLWDILDTYWKEVPSFYGYAAAALVVARVLRARALVAVIVPVVTVAIIVWFKDERGPQAAIRVVTYVGTFTPLLFIVARADAKLWRGGLLVLGPAFAAALAAGYVSTQGADAISLGMQASIVLFALLGARSIERASNERSFATFPAMALMFILVLRCYEYVYRDSAFAQLTEEVKVGPWRGIRTTRDRVASYEELAAIVHDYDKPGGRILFLYEYPGFYLFSRMPPSAECVWEVHYYGQEALLEYWRTHLNGKGITVFVKGSHSGPLLDPIVMAPERKIRETPHFLVYRDP